MEKHEQKLNKPFNAPICVGDKSYTWANFDLFNQDGFYSYAYII
ncbi:MAG: hypothetical protein PHP03_02730 [Candidatus Pacebacteria bacterium]|nr:hypothetical protein [Candidatus Paceibacterota bacterium]